MLLSELIESAQFALKHYGDLECFIDNDIDEEISTELVELVCELDDDEKHGGRVLLTGYDAGFTQLRVVK